MRYYEDLTVGATAKGTATYLVTEQEIIEVGRRWDPQPFHTDPVAAAASPFGGLVASSVHLFAMANAVAVKGDPTAAVSSLGFKEMVNRAPARPGDVLRTRSTVEARRLSRSRPGLGVVETRVELVNQDDEVVFSFVNAALIRCREEPPPLSRGGRGPAGRTRGGR